MKVYVVWICSLLIVSVSQAADVAKPASKAVAPAKSAAAQFAEATVSRETVLAFLSASNKVFIEGEKGRPANSMKYFSAAGIVKNWLNFRFLEVDTEIDKSWYDRVYKMLEYLAKSKDFLELAKINGKTNTDEYRKVLNNFNDVSKRFPELLKDPTPVEKKKLEKLRDEKRKWELEQKIAKAKSGSIKEDE